MYVCVSWPLSTCVHCLSAPILRAQLEEVGWGLHLEMAHSGQAKLKEPSAALQLKVHDDDTQVMAASPHAYTTS